jgi:plastocyanin
MKKIIIGMLIIACGIFAGWHLGKTPLVKKSDVTVVNVPSPVPTTPVPGTYDPKEVPVSGVPHVSNQTKGGVGDQAAGKPAAFASVSYTDTGFKEPVISVKAGTTVTFTNMSASPLWVVSSTGLSGFDQKKSVSRGGTYSFVFSTVGTWKYVNHAAPTYTGIIVVTQ